MGVTSAETLHGAHRASASPSRARVPREHVGVDLALAVIVVLALGGTGLIVAADLADGTAGYETWDVLAFLAVFPALPLMGRLSKLDRLTDREVQVLRAMAAGRSNAAIAENLVLSESAVAKNINSILGKLDLGSEETAVHRRVAAVLTFLSERGTSGVS